jgi:hypothetical protein
VSNRGNPRVFFLYPYPTPPNTLPFIRKTGKYLIYLFCLLYLVASQKSTLLASSTLFSKETPDTFSVLFITFHVLFLIAYLLWFFSKKKKIFF